MGINSKKQKSNIRPVAIKNKAIINNSDKLKSNNIYYLSALLFLLVAVPVFIYLPSLNGKFTNWDDPVYVLTNKNVHTLSLENTIYFFTHSSATNYHPVTMISLSTDYFFSNKKGTEKGAANGLDPVIFHTVNLIFHLINIIFVFLFIYYLSKKNKTIAFITAMLFGLHPMHVESVAWISERKDVLYAFFLLPGLIFYYKYTQKYSLKYYFICMVFFILSLLSKPSAVVFPLLLFAIDYYNKRKINVKLFLEKIPFLTLSLIFGIITLIVQRQYSIGSFTSLTLTQRLFCVSYATLMYLVKMVIPYGLSAFYPFPSLSAAGFLPVIYYLSTGILFLIICLVIFSAKYSRVIVFGFLFFIFSIFLVLQFISVGTALMADRYTYIPFIGPFFITGYYADRLFNYIKNTSLKYGVAGMLLVYMIGLASLAGDRVSIWKNSGSLWTDVIGRFPACDLAYNNRGTYYLKLDSFELARRDYYAAVMNNSSSPMAHRNLGNAYIKLDSVKLAIDSYTKALACNSKAQAYDSNAYLCYLNRGNLYAETKQFNLALQDYGKALELIPDSRKVLANRAHLYADMNDFPNAIEAYNRVIRVDSLRDEYFLKRGFCYYSLNKFAESLSDFEHCIRINPDNGLALYNCSLIYYKAGNYSKALEYAINARKKGSPVNPDYIGLLQKKSH